mmetsp:Transcript_18365/g.44201  ORF Transcript_18365/g.44201 Transcript_18365/m.44201 type:complete len:242 (-) Transcript_18365:232-957(-)
MRCRLFRPPCGATRRPPSPRHHRHHPCANRRLASLCSAWVMAAWRRRLRGRPQSWATAAGGLPCPCLCLCHGPCPCPCGASCPSWPAALGCRPNHPHRPVGVSSCPSCPCPCASACASCPAHRHSHSPRARALLGLCRSCPCPWTGCGHGRGAAPSRRRPPPHACDYGAPHHRHGHGGHLCRAAGHRSLCLGRLALEGGSHDGRQAAGGVGRLACRSRRSHLGACHSRHSRHGGGHTDLYL